MSKIFISYSRHDWAIAEGLAANLSALGHRVWIDTVIDPRVPYASAISDALDGVQLAIVIWSPRSIKSNWVRWEAGEALKSHKLLQLRVEELPVEQVPEPFNKYTVYWDGGPEELAKRIETIISSPPPDGTIHFENPAPREQTRNRILTPSAPSGAVYLYSVAVLAAGLALILVGYRPAELLGTLLVAGVAIGATILALYGTYFSVSRFTDRFGRRLVLEALIVGLLAGTFAGVSGGYLYAIAHVGPSAVAIDSIGSYNLFTIKYVRVIIISAIVGTVLSYLVMAILRFARLRERNLGPAWSRNSATLQILIPIVLTLLLASGTFTVTDNLPVVGKIVKWITFDRINWIGAGRCAALDVYPFDSKEFSDHCSVNRISGVHITLLVAIYLWTIHAYQLNRAGGRAARILASSLVLIAIVFGMMLYYHAFHPEGDRPDLPPLEQFLFVIPWVLLVIVSVATIYSNEREIERAAILGEE